MKKLGLLVTMMVGAFCLFTTNIMGQATTGDVVTYEIPAMANIAIAGTAPSLTFTAPASGAPVAAVISDASWINYTSVVGSSSTNKISVAISSGTLPVSTTLKVTAAADASGGDGAIGTASSTLTLTEAPQDIITAIGSCYTGVGDTKGHQLSYEWSVDATGYASLETAASASDITITYTIAATI